jgi:hypothetical protein
MADDALLPEGSRDGFNSRLAGLATELHRLAEELGETRCDDQREMDDSREDLVAFARILYAVADHLPPRLPASLPMNDDQLDLLMHIGRALEDLRDVSPDPPPAQSKRSPSLR